MQLGEEYFEPMSVGKEPISSLPLLEIKREFNSPVHEIFEVFKSPNALKIWWWPKGLYADHVDVDFREGGQYFINMKGMDFPEGGMTGKFKEIIENQRIVMSDHFADKHGRVISPIEAGMTGVWGEPISITFEFKALDFTKTRLHLMQQGIPEELQKDCIYGWSESFDKLERLLKI